MLLLILTLIVQITLIVHVFRTGRSPLWALAILFVPAIGALAYVIVELWPEFSGGVRGQRLLRSLRETFDPGGDIRRRKREHRLSQSIDSRRRLAEELEEAERWDEAIELYDEALTGLYEDDPNLLFGLARAHVGKGEADEARAVLERLYAENPDFKSPEAHLLYARALEACGRLDAAEQEYERVAGYFAGAEAKYRYAEVLRARGKDAAAAEVLKDLLDAAELAPRHYRKAQKRWLGEARRALDEI